MSRYIGIFFLILGCFFVSSCFGGEFYLGVTAGGSGSIELKNSKAKTSMGYYLGGRIGYQFLSLFRLEEELSYQDAGIHSFKKNQIKFHDVKGHIKTWSFMTNLLLDLDFPLLISPYFGGGIGYAKSEGNWNGKGKLSYPLENPSVKQKLEKNGIAWQLIAGLKYFVCFNLEFSLEYRYFKVENEIINHRLGFALTKLF